MKSSCKLEVPGCQSRSYFAEIGGLQNRLPYDTPEKEP